MLIEWLKNGLEKGHKSQAGLARALGLNPSQVSRMLQGKRRIQVADLPKIAAYIGVPVPDGYGGGTLPNAPDGVEATALVEVEMAGTLEAGRFFPIDEESEPIGTQRSVLMPVGKRYAGARYQGWRVRGDSMNLAGIVDGDHVIAANIIDLGYTPVDGQIVVVQRTRDGGDIERTVKRVRVFSDRVELVPESTNQKHKTVVVPIGQIHDFGEEVAIIGIVTRIIRDV